MTSRDTPSSGNSPDRVTVVVPTRDRGRSVIATISSILKSDHQDFELLIIDQSSSSVTEDAIAAEFNDPRIDYQRVTDTGVSKSRNRGLREATTEYLLMTDDDCIVWPNWISANLEALKAPERPGLVYGDVVAVDDPDGGFTPESVASDDVLVRQLGDWHVSSDGVNIGMGASMSMRRSVVLDIGGFDEYLGPGSDFETAEDTDIALRVLLAGHPIRRLNTTGVDHFGARAPEEFQLLTRSSAFGLGAMTGKLLRSKPLPMARFALLLGWRLVGAEIVRSVAQRRKPPVLGRATFLVRGIVRGLRHPVDSTTQRFH